MKNRVKKTLFIAGAVFAISVLACMAFFAVLGFDAISQDKQSRAVVETAVPAICSVMSMEAMDRLAAPSLRMIRPAEAERAFAIYRTLGRFQSVEQIIGQASQTFSSEKLRTVTAHYLVRTRFENGPAQVEMDLAKNGWDWEITRFAIHSPSFPQGTAALGVPPGQPEVDRIELARDVGVLLAGDEVLLRRDIKKVYDLARLLAGEGDSAQAEALYKKALAVNAADIPAQMELAELLAATGRTGDAATRVRIVWDLAEDAKLAGQARALLDSLGSPPPPSPAVAAQVSAAAIELVPMGNVDPRILDTLRAGLQERMGLAFPVATESVSPGKADRTWKIVFVRDTCQSFRQQMGDGPAETFLSDAKLTDEDLRFHDGQLRFIHAFLERIGPLSHTAVTRFDMEAARAEMLTQYDLARLLKELAARFPLDPRSRVKGYLAVTNQDLYEGESRFRFGGALPGYGVISLKRFTADFNDEDQNRHRLDERLLKQALSSAGFILDIPRCESPDCVRAYPGSLAELDHKPDTLCAVCLERLAACKASLAATTGP